MPIKIAKLNPKYLIILTITIVMLMVVSAYFEITSSKRETFKLLEEEALSLVKAVNSSSENAILSGNEIETQVHNNLQNIALLLKNYSRNLNLQSKEAEEICKSGKVEIAFITDKSGVVKSSTKAITKEFKNEINNLFNNNFLDNSNHSGTIQIEEKEIYLVSSELPLNQGYLFCGIDSKYFMEFRKRIGIGSLFRNLTGQKEIEYVVLQDQEGILAASKNISELSSIESDTFLINTIKNDTAAIRINELDNKRVFEAVMPLIIDSEYFGIVRVGLSMESISLANERMINRIIIMTIVIAGIGVVLLSLLLVNQHRNTIHNELKKLQSYNDIILENMADGVIAISQHNSILFINKNAEKILDTHGFENAGNKINEILIKNNIYSIIKKNEEIKSLEISFKEPHEKIISLSASFARNENNPNNNITILILQDITEERKLQKQLHINEKMAAMGELAGGVAHEVRNPLNSISIITQRLALEYEPKEDLDNYSRLIKTIREEIKRINKIIEQFLGFARKPKIKLNNENISDILSRTVELISAEANNKQIRIDKQIENSVNADIDSDQMQQVFINILKNSLQAIDDSGSISVMLKKFSDKIIIEIADTGKGIEKENLSKIFNLYYSTKPDGTGIGLSIVNQIISEHNGRIEVDSEPGKGTKVRIILKS